jgi:hypothetical protein
MSLLKHILPGAMQKRTWRRDHFAAIASIKVWELDLSFPKDSADFAARDNNNLQECMNR